ncbi:hypothetical protein D3C72_263080 [compost metagenome]
MKIDGWSIDGFGHFHSQTQSGLASGLTVVLGPNEAGKSTLLGFIRAILFGFPARNSAELRYEPSHGGRHGGRLMLSTPQGQYTVQRYADKREPFKLWRPDHSEGSESDLHQLLGYADQRLFKSIFAFSLSELENTKLQKEEGIRDRIFSGSLQGARNSAREALALLSKQNEPVHKAKARSSELLALSERIETQRERIREAQRQSQQYDALLSEESRLIATLAELSDAQGQGLVDTQRAETLLGLWPLWHERKALQQSLERLEGVERFPEQAETRHAALRAKVDECEKACAERELERRELDQRLSAIAPESLLAERASRIGLLHAERSRFQEWLQQRLEDEERCKSATRALGAALELLGAEWTRERLLAFDASLVRQDEVRAWGERLRQADVREFEAERTLKELRRREQEAETQVALHLKQVDALGALPSERELAAREEGLIRLRSTLVEQKEGQAAWESAQERLQALELELSRQVLNAARRLPGGLRRLLWLGALLLLGGAAWSVFTGNVLTGVLLAGAAIAFGSLTLVRVGGGNESVQAMEGLEARLREQRDVLSRLGGMRAATESRLRQALDALGLTGIPSPYELEAAAQRLLHEREALRQALQGNLEGGRLAALCQEAATKREDAERNFEAGQAERLRFAAEWEDWRRARGLAEVQTAQGVMDLFQQVGSARQRLQELTSLEERCAGLDSKLDGYRAEVATLARDLGEPEPASDAAVVQVMESLQARVRKHQEAQQRAFELREALDVQVLKGDAQANELEAARAALEALYTEAGSQDAQEFEHRHAVYRQREECLKAVARLDGELGLRLGEGPKAEELRLELATGDVDGWNALIAAKLEARADLERQRDALNQKLGELQTERRKLEEASDVIAREHEFQALLAEFRRLARAWQVRALAEGMITETLKELERTRQPVVLAHAGELFGHVTEGRYPRLLQAEGGDFRIEDRDGGRREVSVLSRGTSEQLYLCIRLGLVKEFARQSANLPLVMDDVFVNFDPERAHRMAEMLVRFAEEHQVLLFTCHPGTAELLREIHPGVDVLALPRYGEALPMAAKR